MKSNGEHINKAYNFQRILVLFGFVLLIPTIYFLMYPSYLYSIPKPSRYKHRDKVDTIIEENSTNSSNRRNKIFTPQNIPDNVEIDLVSKNFPNIPIKFWNKIKSNSHKMHLSNESCAPFPNMYELDIHNTNWQIIHMSNATSAQLYSAYYDKRIISGKVIRILAMVNRTSSYFPGSKKYYCQLWFDDEEQPVIAPMDKPEYMWFDFWHSHRDGLFGPYLIGCSIPESHQHKVPQVVSFVENPCDKATNMLNVIYEEPADKKEFSICVKGLDFLQIDLSLRLVEWIELVLLLGADKIYMYKLEVHPNVQKVLDYYIREGKVDLRHITLPTGQPSLEYLQHLFLLKNNLLQCLDEIIPYNDCFYRNLYSYDYVGLLDIDEVILPLKDDNWHDLLVRTKGYDKEETKYCGFTARHIYFLDIMQKEGTYEDIPPYMHMMQHTFRAKNFTKPGDYVKTFYSTNYTISCHNHYPISVAPGSLTRTFKVEDARMQHYRRTCTWEVNCTDYLTDAVKDTRMWDFKDILITRVNEAIRNIGF